MRDEGPFDRVGRINGEHIVIGAVVLPEQPFVDLAHLLARQRFPGLHHLVNLQFELGEHDLPEEGATRRLEGRPEIEQTLIV